MADELKRILSLSPNDRELLTRSFRPFNYDVVNNSAWHASGESTHIWRRTASQGRFKLSLESVENLHRTSQTATMMTKERFIGSPFPDLNVTEAERRELIDLTEDYVEEYVQKYKDYVLIDRRRVNKRRWQHVKSRDNLHVYGERSRRALGRRGTTLDNSLSCTQRLNVVTDEKDLSVLLGVGQSLESLKTSCLAS